MSILITVDGEFFARVLANTLRPDLAQRGMGDGRFGFVVWPENRLSYFKRYSVSARRESDGAHVGRSPFVPEAATTFDETMAGNLSNLLTVVGPDADLDSRLTFLAEQTDRLRQIDADRKSGLNERHMRHRRRGISGPPAGGSPQLGDASEMRPRVLVIDRQVPRPGYDAGSNALLSHMRSLQRLGFDVSFVASSLDDKLTHLGEADIEAYARPWISSVEELLSRQRDSFQCVYLHRAEVASGYAALVRRYQSKARMIYSVADLEFLRLARQAQVEERPELGVRSRVSQTAELTAAWHADAVITHSSYEAALLAQNMPAARVHQVAWVVPKSAPGRPFADRSGVAFIGAYGHQPNVDAARWLVTAIMPELEARDPSIPCLLVGSDMPAGLRDLARGTIAAIGHVESLSTVFDRVRVTVAPLAYGAGIQGKVLDSFAAGIPCVCSPLAAEGLDLPPLLLEQVGRDPAELAAKIKRLHDDEDLNRRCAEAGHAYIDAVASETRIDGLMRKVVGPSIGLSGRTKPVEPVHAASIPRGLNV